MCASNWSVWQLRQLFSNFTGAKLPLRRPSAFSVAVWHVGTPASPARWAACRPGFMCSAWLKTQRRPPRAYLRRWPRAAAETPDDRPRTSGYSPPRAARRHATAAAHGTACSCCRRRLRDASRRCARCGTSRRLASLSSPSDGARARRGTEARGVRHALAHPKTRSPSRRATTGTWHSSQRCAEDRMRVRHRPRREAALRAELAAAEPHKRARSAPPRPATTATRAAATCA